VGAPRRGGSWMPLAVLALGGASILLLAAVDRIHVRIVAEDLSLARTMWEVDADLATSHLWLEEAVTGDPLPGGELTVRLHRPRQLLDALLDSSPTLEDEVPQVADPVLWARIDTLRQGVVQFERDAVRRLAGLREGLPVGIGSAADERTDRLFATLSRQIDELNEDLARRATHSREQARMLTLVLLAAWMLIVGLTVAALGRHERHRRAAEATLRARDAQLLQAQKMEAVGRLAGGLAHDINNYLGAITGQAELAQRRLPAGDPLAERMTIILATATRASTLIKRLLAFGRHQPRHPEQVDLNRVIDELLPMTRQLAGPEVELVTRLAPRLGAVEADPAQLEQVLVNLLVNAREAMPDGGRLTVETADRTVGDGASVAPGAWVELRVSDTGIGIPAAVRDKIFEPFFTTKERAGNSGLGLASVYAIVRQSGGQIEVEGAEGRGTTFRVLLPQSGAAAPAPEPSAQPAQIQLAGIRVLLVEDSAALRATTREMLESFGCRVSAAASAEEALARFAHSGVDLVVTDVVMTGLSGIELARRLRAEHPGLPILLVSGHAPDTAAHLQLGVSFLPKPFSADALARKVRDTLAAAAIAL
jgi:signal transduction histidine kinase